MYVYIQYYKSQHISVYFIDGRNIKGQLTTKLSAYVYLIKLYLRKFFKPIPFFDPTDYM